MLFIITHKKSAVNRNGRYKKWASVRRNTSPRRMKKNIQNQKGVSSEEFLFKFKFTMQHPLHSFYSIC